MHLDREILENPTQFALIVFHLSTALLHTQEVTGSSPVVRTRNDRKSKDFRSFSMHILDRIFCYIRVFLPLFQQICNFSETTFYQVRNKFETTFPIGFEQKMEQTVALLLHLCLWQYWTMFY